MSGFKHQYVGEPTIGNIRHANHEIGAAENRTIPGLRYLWVRPWISVIFVSLAMWASIAWLVRLVWLSL
jgi:hypothetical protein